MKKRFNIEIEFEVSEDMIDDYPGDEVAKEDIRDYFLEEFEGCNPKVKVTIV